jgi:hypothetical protein
VGLIRAALTDDPDSGILIMRQHGSGPGGPEVRDFMMALSAVGARLVLAGHGYNVARVVKVLDALADEYAAEAARVS